MGDSWGSFGDGWLIDSGVRRNDDLVYRMRQHDELVYRMRRIGELVSRMRRSRESVTPANAGVHLQSSRLRQRLFQLRMQIQELPRQLVAGRQVNQRPVLTVGLFHFHRGVEVGVKHRVALFLQFTHQFAG